MESNPTTINILQSKKFKIYIKMNNYVKIVKLPKKVKFK